jgi:ribonuclease HI
MVGRPGIFTDGACSGNGTARAVAGWAWAYWPAGVYGEPETAGAERLTGVATNQRAELMALLKAMEWWSTVGGGGSITLYTDSLYSINCISKWGPAWRRKGWKRDSGEPLQNLDLIQPLVALWRPAWQLVHVRGHQSGHSPEAHGNNWVDRAAVAAAQGQRLVPATAVAAPVAKTTLDVIEHVDTPATNPFFRSNTVHAPAKQTDIRMWFGYSDA